MTPDEFQAKYVNKIICGDCLEVMAEMPNGCIDCVVTSPPYDDLRKYNGYTFEFEPISSELFRIMGDGAVLVWIVSDATVRGSETGTSMKQALHFKSIGLRLYDTMIWYKGVQTTPTEGRYYAAWEFMFVFSKGLPSCVTLLCDRANVSAGSRRQSLRNCRKEKRVYGGKVFTTQPFGRRFNVWTVNPTCVKNNHPAVFPLQIAKDHIYSWSNNESVVIDPMCGSGTTCVAAKMLGRNYIGIDISEEYCQIARDRLNALDTGVPVAEARAGQMGLFP